MEALANSRRKFYMHIGQVSRGRKEEGRTTALLVTIQEKAGTWVGDICRALT